MAMRAIVQPQEDSVQLAASISNKSSHYQYDDAPLGGGVGGAVTSTVARHAVMNEGFYDNSFHDQSMKGRHMAQLRKVKQFLVDPSADDSLPLEKRILHEGPEFWTDETDQELQHRVPVVELLKKHNDYRVTVIDKTHRGDKDRNLEPTKLRYLRLTTVTVFSV